MQQNILRQLSQMADERNQPISCSFELTRRCNYKCRHCYLPVEERLTGGHIPLEAGKRFIEDLKKMGGFNITFTGGEPLLYPELSLELMKHARKEGLISILFTNASLVTKDLADRIAATR